MGKRGQLSIQFNWIFVLIVGAIILVFFANIVRTQQKLSTNKVSATVLNDLDAISSGAEVSRGTVQIINIPNLDLGFSCSETCACSYSLANTQVAFGEKIMFAPSSIQGRRITAWTFDWSMPYRVSNMLYMTSPSIRYIFLDDLNRNLAEDINSTLPPRSMILDGNEEIIFNKEIIDPRDFEDIVHLNNYKIKIIGFFDPSASPNCNDMRFFNPTCDLPLAFQDLPDLSINGVQIKGTQDSGEVTFYKKQGAGWSNDPRDVVTLPYLGEAMLYAAIYSEDSDLYRCGVERLFEKMTYVTKVYIEKTKALKNIATDANCRFRYSDAISRLDNSGDSIKGIADDVLQNGITQDKFLRLNSFAFGGNQLDDLNKILQRSSCVELY
tara:strand:- start:3456 stop:4601 length:1146 start_codon:yes stop_codon:yes gene_type:complete